MWSVGKDVVKMWNNWNPHTLLVEMQNGTSTLKNKVFLKFKVKLLIPSNTAVSFLSFYTKA